MVYKKKVFACIIPYQQATNWEYAGSSSKTLPKALKTLGDMEDVSNIGILHSDTSLSGLMAEPISKSQRRSIRAWNLALRFGVGLGLSAAVAIPVWAPVIGGVAIGTLAGSATASSLIKIKHFSIVVYCAYESRCAELWDAISPDVDTEGGLRSKYWLPIMEPSNGLMSAIRKDCSINNKDCCGERKGIFNSGHTSGAPWKNTKRIIKYEVARALKKADENKRVRDSSRKDEIAKVTESKVTVSSPRRKSSKKRSRRVSRKRSRRVSRKRSRRVSRKRS